MIEHESLQRAAAREQPGVLEHESIQCAAAREQPGVLKHESIQRANAHLDPERREEDQSTNTSQRATASLDPARREEENEQQHSRREQPGVIKHESLRNIPPRLCHTPVMIKIHYSYLQ